jgi:hypothetical protein
MLHFTFAVRYVDAVLDIRAGFIMDFSISGYEVVGFHLKVIFEWRNCGKHWVSTQELLNAKKLYFVPSQ